MAVERGHVWLPSLGVWAPCPSPDPYPNPNPSSNPSSNPRHSPNPSYSHSPNPSLSHRPDPSPSPSPSSSSSPYSCPICLVPAEDGEVAALRWCMHRFCLPCIRKWSTLQRFCPLCKANFDGWLYEIRGSSQYSVEMLSPLQGRAPPTERFRDRRHSNLGQARGLSSFRRSFPLRTVRSFRSYKRFLSPSTIEALEESRAAERALKWRASIYKKNLRAIPRAIERGAKLPRLSDANLDVKARLERRLEPWIRRELEALTGDNDVSILVHVVLSLWFSQLTKREQEAGPSNQVVERGIREKRSEAYEGESEEDSDAIRQLSRYVGDKASSSVFWHEFKCFAESPFTMKAYDSVVQYHKATRS